MIKGLKCPHCGTEGKMIKAGFRYDKHGRHQCYFCRNRACLRYTIHPKKTGGLFGRG